MGMISYYLGQAAALAAVIVLAVAVIWEANHRLTGQSHCTTHTATDLSYHTCASMRTRIWIGSSEMCSDGLWEAEKEERGNKNQGREIFE